MYFIGRGGGGNLGVSALESTGQWEKESKGQQDRQNIHTKSQ